MGGRANAPAAQGGHAAVGIGHGQRAKIVAAVGTVFGEEEGPGVADDVADGAEAFLD